MSRCHRRIVPGVTISRIAARQSIGSSGQQGKHARSGHVSRTRAPGRPRPATASWWRRMSISASFHHASRRDKPSSDTARETIRKISFSPQAEDHPTSGRAKTGPPQAERSTVLCRAFAQAARVVGTLRRRSRLAKPWGRSLKAHKAASRACARRSPNRSPGTRVPAVADDRADDGGEGAGPVDRVVAESLGVDRAR